MTSGPPAATPSCDASCPSSARRITWHSPWVLITAALAGDFHEAVEVGERFRLAWEEAGRPAIGVLGMAPAAAAMVHGIRGDDDARREWLGILTEMRSVRRRGDEPYTEFLDAMVALHRGQLDEALARLADGPESLRRWHDGAWRQWYAALWAEAAVLAELADRRERLDRARFIVGHNPIASAIVDRADAIDTGDTDRLLAAAAALDAAGCRYQHARTLVFAGGDGEGRRRGDHGGNRRDTHGGVIRGGGANGPSAQPIELRRCTR